MHRFRHSIASVFCAGAKITDLAAGRRRATIVALVMVRMLVGMPTLLFALVALAPQRIVADAPASPAPSPAATATAASGWVQTSGPGWVQSSGPATSTTIGPGPTIPLSPESIRRQTAEFQKVTQEQRAFRQSMLAALTPAHRQLLAQIVGELAIAQNPDPQSATRRLNAALSPREAQNVVRIEQAKDAATLQHFQQLAAESGASMPARNNVMFHGVPPSSSTVMSVRASASFGNDAGSILLRTAASALLMPRFNVFSSGSQMLPPLLPRH